MKDTVADETPVQHENEEHPSSIPDEQFEPVSVTPKLSSRFQKPTKYYGNPIPTDLLKKERGCDDLRNHPS